MKKKITTIMTMFLLAITSLGLTSCEDEAIASTLEGTWEGNMYISSEWNGRVYDATYTEIEFLLDPFRFTKGSGYWVDHYSNAPWDYIACHIDWRVDNGCITVYFREEDSQITIEDYRLSDNLFTGTIYDYDKRVKFALRHTSSPNWEDEYDYWGYDDWYYGWSRKNTILPDGNASRATGDSITIGKPKRIVRIR